MLMYSICPTITVTTPEDYLLQLNLASSLSNRVHLDISDGTIAPRKLIDLDYISWPDNLIVDLHLMSNTPDKFIDQILRFKTNLLIMHKPNINKLEELSIRLRTKNIKTGVAISSTKDFNTLKNYFTLVDHVMFFSGNLGYQGGSVMNLDLLDLIKEVRLLNPKLEFGWDGGINETNIYQLKQAGVTVFNVGSYIQSASVPKDAYDKLIAEIERQ